MITKFGNYEELFEFLDRIRPEICEEFNLQEMTTEKLEEPHETVIQKEENLQKQADIDDDGIDDTIMDDMIMDEESICLLEQDTCFVQSNSIQMKWSTSLETPDTVNNQNNSSTFNNNNTDTTIIMEQLTLHDSYLEEEETIYEELADPLGLELLTFPMSQFPVDEEIEISEKSVKEEEENSIEIFDDLNFSEFDAAEDKESEFDIDISMSQFPSTQVALKPAEEAEVTDFEFEIERDEEVLPEAKEVSLKSKEVLSESKELLPHEVLSESKEVLKRTHSSIEQEDETEKENFIFPMFTTGNGKALPPPSREAMKRAKSLVSNVEMQTEFDEPVKHETAMPLFTGFSTGRGVKLAPPSEEAMNKAKNLVNSIKVDAVNSSTDLNEETALNSEAALNRDVNIPSMPLVGFSTAKGKKLAPPSEDSMKRATTLINQDEEVPKSVGFSTGRGAKLAPPSEDAMKRASSLLNNTNDKKNVMHNTKKPLVPGNTAFKPPSRVGVSLQQQPVKQPFSLSNAWKIPRRQVKPTAPVPVPPQQIKPVNLFDLSREGLQRFKLKEFFKQTPNLQMTLKDYEPFSIPEGVLLLNSELAKGFKFPNGWGYEDAHKCLLEACKGNLHVSPDWTGNHFRWIIWKFASLIRTFPENYSAANLSPEWLLQQLFYRYEREVHLCHRSALKKIVERDDAAGKYLCLMVAGIDFERKCLELSDGWYSCWTAPLDPNFWDLIERKRIAEGVKIEISGASLTGQDGIPVLDAANRICECRLMIWRNSCRPAKWDTKLGFIFTEARAVTFLKHLHQIHPQGGPIPAVSLIIDRLYPLLFREERTEDGHVISRNERDHYLYLEGNPEQAQQSKFTPIQRVRVQANHSRTCSAIISFWNPLSEDQRALLQEGSAVIITNLRTRSSTKPLYKSNQINLVSTKSTRIFKDATSPESSFTSLTSKIELSGGYERLKDLKLADYYDVQGIALGRVGSYFWIGDIDITAPNNHFLICLKNFPLTQFTRGDLINFRDLLFNHFDCKEGVAHFSFNEFSDFKREPGSTKTAVSYDESYNRFKQLTCK